ncbi:MAG: PilT/PilU family type 4a pilus ATPase [Lachnospiraceae bacterium]|jgi:twitching motility protein PilT|nr:PilT/PilU family type 4a pilus ATPase [Lachnospiraceae bacterium]
MQIKEILTKGQKQEASDIFIIPGSRVCLKKNGEIFTVSEEVVMPADSEELIRQIYKIARRDIQGLLLSGDDDFSFSMQGTGRFRCNAYRQRNSLAAVIRIVAFGLPDSEKMHIPQEVMDLVQIKNGMILVTGPAGSGKSTTLACLINRINQEKNGHIITIEDPIEFIHSHGKSLVSQREIDHDTQSYAAALRAALRQTPNVILLGEMRDVETIQIAMTAVETGQLLLSTLHTVGAAKTIDRIVDAFPDHQQTQARVQISMLLKAVVSQQLLPTIDGGLEPVFEIMIVNPAIQNMIREGKSFQMDNVIYTGTSAGMRTMDSDILRLYKEGRITKDTAMSYAVNPVALEKKL